MRFLTLLCVILLSGCSPQTDDLQQFVEEVKQQTSVNIEPYPKFEKPPVFAYQAATLRSPFLRPKNLVPEPQQQKMANCLQPDFKRQKQALENYGTDALTISGFFTSQGRQWALILANDGTLHKVSKGDHLGLFFGKIISIQNGTISYQEMLPDGTGCWQVKNAQLAIPSKAGEKDNV